MMLAFANPQMIVVADTLCQASSNVFLLKITSGCNFCPFDKTLRTTVNNVFSFPVVRIGTVEVPVLSTVHASSISKEQLLDILKVFRIHETEKVGWYIELVGRSVAAFRVEEEEVEEKEEEEVEEEDQEQEEPEEEHEEQEQEGKEKNQEQEKQESKKKNKNNKNKKNKKKKNNNRKNKNKKKLKKK
ncbi:hypothetical protein TURU_093555 [Turdus rufiventris]|nr:hypothetical protein TURU_093555 [Turdus rufiventris]